MFENEYYRESEKISEDPLIKKTRKKEAEGPKDFRSAKPGDRIIDDLSDLFPKEEKTRRTY